MTRVRRHEVWRRAGFLQIGSAIGLLALTGASAVAQSNPSRLQGPPFSTSRPAPASDDEILRREQFRRRAAEAAQKQLEQLAEQLREQLALEVTARKSAQEALARTVTRNKLTDQIDEERQRLRRDQIESLKARRDTLEQQVLQLTRRLADESARRKKLEENIQKAGGAASKIPPGATTDKTKLNARIQQLEQALNAEKWARRLTEAQLRLLQQRRAKN
jgi:hypothetical protein